MGLGFTTSDNGTTWNHPELPYLTMFKNDDNEYHWQYTGYFTFLSCEYFLTPGECLVDFIIYATKHLEGDL